jgi:FdhE protein
MVQSATVRVMSAEEIAARAGGETPFLRWPDAAAVFDERAMRLRQLAAGHPLSDYLTLMARLSQAQQRALAALQAAPVTRALPDIARVDAAARQGLPLLPAADGPLDAAWRGTAREIAQRQLDDAPVAVRPTLAVLTTATDDWLDTQARAVLQVLQGERPSISGFDPAVAPFIAAALQVEWTHVAAAVRERHGAGGQPFGRIDDETACPCCGSRPVASVTRSGGESLGQRYLHCGLCGTEWHMVRIKCSHCLSTKSLAFQSLDLRGDEDASEADGEATRADSRAATAPVQAETCDDCGHYLKIVHTDRDPMVEPVADDLATVTLDLLVGDAGLHRHGRNPLLFFADPDPGRSAAAPPDPGAA